MANSPINFSIHLVRDRIEDCEWFCGFLTLSQSSFLSLTVKSVWGTGFIYSLWINLGSTRF